MNRRTWTVLACLPIWNLTAAVAQTPAPNSTYTSFDAVPGKPVQLGYYASAKKDCTPAPLPDLQIMEPPKSGYLIVRKATLTTNKIAGCPNLKTAAQVVFYQARPASTGGDRVVYKVRTPNGEVGTYDVTITIKPAPGPSAPPVKPEKI